MVLYRTHRTTSRPGFTLVELLVVIGIIALLIAILLPSLATARKAAQSTKCLAQLQQMMVAANMHAAERRGYFPLAGNLAGLQPSELSDTNREHYVYETINGQLPSTFIAPITLSLGTYMGYKRLINNNTVAAQVVDDKADNGLIRHFLCPSQASRPEDVKQPGLPAYRQAAMLFIGHSLNIYNGGDNILEYFQAQSYIYNESALGFSDPVRRARGQSSRIRQPSMTMFAADGLGCSYTRVDGTGYGGKAFSPAAWTGAPLMTVFNKTANDGVTMADAYLGNDKAGDPENFDLKRHGGRINIAFCDGHCESRLISVGGLGNVYLTAP